MQNQAGDKAGCRFDPVFVMGAFFAASAQHLRDVLRVGDLAQRSDAHLGQRIEACAMLFDWRKAKADLASGNPIARGAVPVLSFDVEDHRALLPTPTVSESRGRRPCPIVSARMRECARGLRVSGIRGDPFFILPRPDVDAVLLIRQTGLFYFFFVRPSGASMKIFGVLGELSVLVYVEQGNNEECCCKP
jgi:hypothetical protein